MRASLVAGLVPGSLRSMGQRPIVSTHSSWAKRARVVWIHQRRNDATLAEAPSLLDDLAIQPEVIPESARRAQSKKILMSAVAATAPRTTWTRQEISAIYYQPVLELAYQAVGFLSLKLGNGAILTKERAPFTDGSTAPARSSYALS